MPAECRLPIICYPRARPLLSEVDSTKPRQGDDEMFVNLETSTIKELVNGQADSRWTAEATQFLLAGDRNVAVGKLAGAIWRYVYTLGHLQIRWR